MVELWGPTFLFVFFFFLEDFCLLELSARSQLCTVWQAGFLLSSFSCLAAVQGLTNPPVTQVYATCPDRWSTTTAQSVCESVCVSEGDFSGEREGLRKQRGEGREDEHLLENILFFVESKWVRIKEMSIKKAIRKTWWVSMLPVKGGAKRVIHS